jgi:hypothetical protein
MKHFILFSIILILGIGSCYSEGKIKERSSYSGIAASEKMIDSVAIDNEYVKVMLNSTICSQAHTFGFGTRVIVALADLQVEGRSGNKKLKRGEIAVFTENESYKEPTGEYFEVAFKTKHPPYKGPEEWLEPVKNKIVYEDKQFRVFVEILEPGETRPLHSHAQRVVVKLNPARLTDPRYNEEGNKKGSLQVPNSIKFVEPIVHVVQNISDVPLYNIVIEFIVPVMQKD